MLLRVVAMATLALAALSRPATAASACALGSWTIPSTAHSDRCRWEDFSQGVHQPVGELVVESSAVGTFSRAAVLSQYRLLGDFDVQVGYRIGAGWSGALQPAGAYPASSVPRIVLDDSDTSDSRRATRQRGDRGLHEHPVRVQHGTQMGQAALAGTHRLVRSGRP